MRRVDAAPPLAAVGSVLLLASLFLHWYQPGLSAWTAFEVLDLVLAALSLAALWLAGMNLLRRAPIRDGALPVIGGAAFVVVVSQLLNHPPAARGAGLQGGAWLALAASTLMAVAGVLDGAGISLGVSLPDAPAAAPEARRVEDAAADEAAAVEPEVHGELYPEQRRGGPIGADDPEPWTASPDDETLSIEPEAGESG